MIKIRHYILAVIVFLVICYLSLFKPPSIGEVSIPHLDKVVHFCMYFGFSSILWVDFFRSNEPHNYNNKRGWLIGGFLPILLSGCIELLQEYCTSYRGGEWLDLLANSLGVLSASSLFYFVFSKKKWFRAIIHQLSRIV